MSIIKETTIADQADNHKRLMFFAMLLLALIHGVKTVVYLVDEQTGSYLGLIAKSLSVLFAITAFVLVFWRIAIVAKTKESLWPSSDSFVMQVRDRACVISWVLTFALLSLIMTTTSRDSSAQPTEFYLNLTIFFMLTVFSVSFFILFRTQDDEESEQIALK